MMTLFGEVEAGSSPAGKKARLAERGQKERMLRQMSDGEDLRERPEVWRHHPELRGSVSSRGRFRESRGRKPTPSREHEDGSRTFFTDNGPVRITQTGVVVSAPSWTPVPSHPGFEVNERGTVRQRRWSKNDVPLTQRELDVQRLEEIRVERSFESGPSSR